MEIATGASESHPNVLALDASATPATVAATPRFPSGSEQGGVAGSIAGVDFTGEAAAAMAAGMAADADRRGRYEASMSPLGASAGDAMNLPVVPANVVPAEQSDLYPFSGMEPTEAGAGMAGPYPAA